MYVVIHSRDGPTTSLLVLVYYKYLHMGNMTYDCKMKGQTVSNSKLLVIIIKCKCTD